MFVCVWMQCVGVWVKGQRAMLGAMLSVQGLTLDLKFSSLLDWLASELQGPVCLSSGLRLQVAHHVGLGNPNSGFHASVATSLLIEPSEPSPQPHLWLLKILVVVKYT